MFFALDLGEYLNLSYLKQSRAEFQNMYQTHALLFMVVYFLVYITVVTLSLPGAAVMSLFGGALFGFWKGLIVISFASSIGATLACAVSRYVIGQSVQAKFGDRLVRVNQGIEREGAFYLFTMRLIPAIPFFIINLVMGLTTMRLRTFYWVSQVGMLPGTAVYVNAGKELGKLDSLSGILSPSLIASFVILGLFPITVKKLMQVYRRRAGLGQPVADDVPLTEAAPENPAPEE